MRHILIGSLSLSGRYVPEMLVAKLLVRVATSIVPMDDYRCWIRKSRARVRRLRSAPADSRIDGLPNGNRTRFVCPALAIFPGEFLGAAGLLTYSRSAKSASGD